ncbi:hypothetical protein ACJ41O_015093 [Fusarium nematophilum]
MAELAAALSGIIAAGTKVARVLSTTASEVGSKEAQVMAREIRSFCSILRNINQTIETVQDPDHLSHFSELVSEMTAVSREMFTEILDLVHYMQESSWGSRVNLAARIRWVVDKPKLTFLRTAIETYKADLCLLLASMQFAQSLNAGGSTTAASSAELAQPLDRTSRVLSQNLEELAVEYQSSLQELEVARQDLVDNGDETFDNVDPSGSWDIPAFHRNSRFEGVLKSLHEEVRSLRSNTTSMYSTAPLSIYSSLSTHSDRLSVLVEQIAPGSSPELENLQRTSQRMSQARSVYRSTLIQEAIPSAPEHTSVSVLEEMQSWPGGTPPWGYAPLADALVQTLERSCIVLNDEERCTMYLRWAMQAVDGVSALPHDSRRPYLRQLSGDPQPLVSGPRANTPPPRRPPRPQIPELEASHPYSYETTPPPPPRPEPETSDSPSTEIFKSFRVGMEDPCWKVLPLALRKYNIDAAPDQYMLYIVYGDRERLLGPEEKPLVLFKQLDKEGEKPMFMLRRKAPENRLPVPEEGGFL